MLTETFCRERVATRIGCEVYVPQAVVAVSVYIPAAGVVNDDVVAPSSGALLKYHFYWPDYWNYHF